MNAKTNHSSAFPEPWVARYKIVFRKQKYKDNNNNKGIFLTKYAFFVNLNLT